MERAEGSGRNSEWKLLLPGVRCVGERGGM